MYILCKSCMYEYRRYYNTEQILYEARLENIIDSSRFIYAQKYFV